MHKKFHTAESIRLETIFKTTTEGIVTIDERGVIESANPAVAVLFGYSIEEITGKPINLLMPAHHAENHDDYIENYLRTGKAKIIGFGREVNGQKKDGKLFPIRLNVSEMFIGGKRYFTGIIHDLTAEKATAHELSILNRKLENLVEKRTAELESTVNRLLESNRKLEFEITERKAVEKTLRNNEKLLKQTLDKEIRLNDLKSRFLTMASHEFRTPLSQILAAAELIETYIQKQSTVRLEKNVSRIKNAVHSIMLILNDFLSLSNLEKGEVTPRPKCFEVASFINKLKEASNRVLKHGQQLCIDQKINSQCLFEDEQILYQIIFNLINNAGKYSNENGKIYLSFTKKNNQLWIIVKDEGIGIPSEDQPLLFSRFFRGGNVENIHGTGLGLNITKKYVELLGGNISFVSQLGEGTTFTLNIPIKTATT